MNLLIVDDHPLNRKLLRAQLEGENHRVTEAANGVEGLRALERGEIEGIVSDILMPEMDGFRFCQEVRKSGRFSALPFVLYTSTYDSPQDRNLAKAVGADCYLSKPASIDRLVDAITEASRNVGARVPLNDPYYESTYVLKQYNAALVRKLEERNLELEKAMQGLKSSNDELKKREEQLKLFVEHAPAAIAMLDINMCYLTVSARWLSDHRLKDRNILGRSHYDVFPEVPEAWRSIHRRCLRGEVFKSDEESIVRTDGTIEWLKREIYPWRKTGDEVEGIIIFSEVITDRKAAEEKIKRLNRVHDVMSNISSLLLRFRDRNELYTEACRIATEHGHFGIAWIGTYDQETMQITPVAWSGIDLESLESRATLVGGGTDISPGIMARLLIEFQPVVFNDIEKSYYSGVARREEVIRRGYHSMIILPLVVSDQIVGSFSLFARDVDFFDSDEIRLLTQLAGDISFALQYLEKQEIANYLAYYDALTGLPNRALFMEHLSHAVIAASDATGHLVLALGDIKRFRQVNDTLGRHAGDELLKQLSARLLTVLTNPENVARVSANSFATFLPGIGDVAEVAHRIELLMKEVIDRPLTISGQEINLAFAVGVAVYPHDGLNAETLFRNAEAALTKAKSEGERYLFYAPEMNSRVAESLALESRLKRALEQEQFILHYQPKVNVANGVITGMEALIRWQDPELGLVAPARFIPLMEETGLILEAGRWALDRAIKDYHSWWTAGLNPPRVAVNVSSRQLRQKNFIDSILRAIEGFGEADVALDIEVTESVIIDDIQEATKKLQVLRGLGVEVSIDDFGTGYSSLGYIAKLPINSVKIDRSFIVEMVNDEYCQNIVKMIISLAHTLRLKVVAEGVDDEQHVHILRALKCDEMQGYLVSKPIPAAAIEVLLQQASRSIGGTIYQLDA